MDNPTIRAYDRFADAYDKGVIEFWEGFPRDFLVSFAQLLPGKRVLSVGSGSGRDALLLRDLGREVVCVDAAPRMVAMTRALGFTSYQAGFDTLKVLPLAPQSFDGVWAHGSIIHIPKREAADAVRQLRAFLVPDGAFAIGAIAGSGEGTIGHDDMPGVARYVQFYQNDELRQLITPVGFRFVHQQDYVLPYGTFLNHVYVKAKASD